MLIGGHVSTTNMAGKKRKKNINSDEETVATKISRKSKNKKIQSVGVEDAAKAGAVPKRRDFEKRNKQTFNPVKDNGGKIKKSKERGPKSDVHKHTIKQKSKSPTNTNMTQRLEKQLEARRKRRAKRKVMTK